IVLLAGPWITRNAPAWTRRPGRWLATASQNLAGQTTPLARTLLGAVMGLLPCGLVYAALIASLAAGRPWLAAAGMIAFGLGTTPALLAAGALARSVPRGVRAHAGRLAAVALIVAGGWMIGRSAMAAQTPDCHVSHPTPAATVADLPRH
ncbi:MAG: sulfite exporter TauE/SafE family protein, partial [Phycisphaeraceae bacterium]|nr:sulfite exporter TauE/SafE family protein [Phycisphaeraceae bacterium]